MAVSLIFVSFRQGCAQEVLDKKPGCEPLLAEKRGLPLPKRAGETPHPDLDPGHGGRRPERVSILARARGVHHQALVGQKCSAAHLVSEGAPSLPTTRLTHCRRRWTAERVTIIGYSTCNTALLWTRWSEVRSNLGVSGGTHPRPRHFGLGVDVFRHLARDICLK